MPVTVACYSKVEASNRCQSSIRASSTVQNAYIIPNVVLQSAELHRTDQLNGQEGNRELILRFPYIVET